MTVHRAARVFGDVADLYDRGRPGYSDEAVAWLVRALGVRPGRTVVDLAAGTGKLTVALARTRARVIAIEPSAGMLRRLTAALPDVEAHRATAEAMPLPDACADAVTVAQAFHWFAGDAAATEIARVLRPGGRLGLIWNRRVAGSVARLAELEELIDERRGDTPAHQSGAWLGPLERSRLLVPRESARLDFEQRLDVDGIVARVGSISYVAALPAAERADLLARVERVGRRLGEPIVLPYVTDLYVYERR